MRVRRPGSASGWSGYAWLKEGGRDVWLQTSSISSREGQPSDSGVDIIITQGSEAGGLTTEALTGLFTLLLPAWWTLCIPRP